MLSISYNFTSVKWFELWNIHAKVAFPAVCSALNTERYWTDLSLWPQSSSLLGCLWGGADFFAEVQLFSFSFNIKSVLEFVPRSSVILNGNKLVFHGPLLRKRWTPLWPWKNKNTAANPFLFLLSYHQSKAPMALFEAEPPAYTNTWSHFQQGWAQGGVRRRVVWEHEHPVWGQVCALLERHVRYNAPAPFEYVKISPCEMGIQKCDLKSKLISMN